LQDIVVYISLKTAVAEKETLLPLILSLEGAFAYKEYANLDAVAVDFASDTSPTKLCAKALFEQINIENCPGRVKKIAIFGLAGTSTPAEVTAALDTLRETNDDWYFLIPTVTTSDLIASLSTWASATVLTQAQLEAGAVESEKLLLVQTTDKAVITDALKANKQTVICYNHDAANSYIPPAWVGRTAPNYPEGVTWKWKELYGIPATDEAGTDLHTLLEGRYNLYIDNLGRQYMSEGICTDGDFIDTVIGRWQIKQSIRSRLVNLFVDNEVVPYDNDGFTMVGAAIISALNEAVENGIILKQNGGGAYTVNIPTRSDATEEQAANRTMPPITWEATMRGGVHSVNVSGQLTVELSGTGL
jgi:hypothetical protein